LSGDYLLDTHVWLWALLDPTQLKKKTRGLLRSPDVTFWLSPISVWETLLLVERGRLELDVDPRRWIRDAMASSGVGEASLNHEVALWSREVDVKHDDPADRFIAATASVYQLTLLTADERLLRGSGYERMSA
jgi:PIN domain nuclease of toxin-antitoxin system